MNFKSFTVLCVVAFISVLQFSSRAEDKPEAARPQTAEMVFIPEGEFTMGTSAEEAQQLAKEYKVHPDLILLEAPKRKVNLKAFWIDRFPVTNRQFLEFFKSTNKTMAKWPDGKIQKELEDCPVLDVSWPEAVEYAKWAGKRLPTAEEWEKAARGTDGRLYPWGNEWKDTATMRRPPDAFMPPSMISYTIPVGCFPEGASPYGVMDMCGNVPEWTATPTTKDDFHHVVKGVSTTCNLKCYFRCASVAFSDTWQARGGKGFRCAKDATGSPPDSYKLAPLMKRDAPPFPQPQAPREDLYLKQTIRLDQKSQICVPYLPDGFAGIYTESVRYKTGEPNQSKRLFDTPCKRSEWKLSKDGTRLEREKVFTEQLILMRVVFEAHLDYVDYKLTLKNESPDASKTLSVNNCQASGAMPYFYDQEDTRTYIITDSGPTRLIECLPGGKASPLYRGWPILPAGKAGSPNSVARLPFVCTVSPDGKWVMAVTGPGGQGISRNANYSCLHIGQDIPELKPGMEHTQLTRIYFLRGGVQDALQRWKKDLASGALDTTSSKQAE